MKKLNYPFYTYLGVVLALAVILVFGVYSAQQPGRMFARSKALATEEKERGAEVFRENCIACHGSRGEGVRNVGPALNTQEFLKAATDELIFNTITDGRPGTAMPAWGQSQGGPFTPQIVDDLVAFIRSWQPTAPSAAEIVYHGDPVSGAILFSTTCYACHGLSGSGTEIAPQLAGAPILDDNEALYATISKGRIEAGMPQWGQVLSPAEINDVIAYLHTLSAAPATVAGGGSVANGARIFTAACVTCHGLSGEGVTGLGPTLRPNEFVSNNSDKKIAAVIFSGSTHGEMPGQTGLLSESEVNDLIALLRSWQKSSAPAAELQKPDLEAAQFLYVVNCAPCHGAAGEGLVGPALVNNQFVQNNDDQSLLTFITNGRPNTAMAGFAGRLTNDEILSIIEFLRTWQ